MNNIRQVVGNFYWYYPSYCEKVHMCNIISLCIISLSYICLISSISVQNVSSDFVPKVVPSRNYFAELVICFQNFWVLWSGGIILVFFTGFIIIHQLFLLLFTYSISYNYVYIIHLFSVKMPFMKWSWAQP